jgi:hypothetical protein
MTVPLRDAPPAAVADLRARLLDGSAPLADRYRALFALRNISGADAEDSLAAGEKRRGGGKEGGGGSEGVAPRQDEAPTHVCVQSRGDRRGQRSCEGAGAGAPIRAEAAAAV